MEVKDFLKNRRLELGLTIKQIADAVGVSEGTVSRWESGKINNMKRDKISALSKILNIDPLTIMGRDDVEETQQQSYYYDEETAKIAQEIFDNKDLHALLDSARGNKPENLRLAAEMLARMKDTNPDG